MEFWLLVFTGRFVFELVIFSSVGGSLSETGCWIVQSNIHWDLQQWSWGARDINLHSPLRLLGPPMSILRHDPLSGLSRFLHRQDSNVSLEGLFPIELLGNRNGCRGASLVAMILRKFTPGILDDVGAPDLGLVLGRVTRIRAFVAFRCCPRVLVAFHCRCRDPHPDSWRRCYLACSLILWSDKLWHCYSERGGRKLFWSQDYSVIKNMMIFGAAHSYPFDLGVEVLGSYQQELIWMLNGRNNFLAQRHFFEFVELMVVFMFRASKQPKYCGVCLWCHVVFGGLRGNILVKSITNRPFLVVL